MIFIIYSVHTFLFIPYIYSVVHSGNVPDLHDVGFEKKQIEWKKISLFSTNYGSIKGHLNMNNWNTNKDNIVWPTAAPNRPSSAASAQH